MCKCEWWSSTDLLSDSGEAAEVSVIIPCYQAAVTIGRALASVAAQSCKPFEVIIVDDGSDAETCNRLKELTEKYGSDWLKVYFLDKNCGPASARNFGWERARAPFVAFLDADDSWHKDKIALQFAFMLQNPEISICSHRCGGAANIIRKLPQKVRITNRTFKKLLFRNRLYTPTVMLKRALVLHFPEATRYSEDYYLWLALLNIGYTAVFIDLPLTALHKPAFGDSGLSAELWQMEKGELKALQATWNRGSVSSLYFATAVVWSLAKYARRVLLSINCNKAKKLNEYSYF